MSDIASRLTTKYQATIPQPVREALGLKSGDVVRFEINESGVVCLRKQQPFDVEYARALNGTLASEWSSADDEAAYRDL